MILGVIQLDQTSNQDVFGNLLEDHPRTCKWLITMVNKSPSLVFFPFQMAVSWLTNGSDPDHLLTGDFGPTLFGVAPYLPAQQIVRQASVSGLVSSNRKLHCPPYLIDR